MRKIDELPGANMDIDLVSENIGWKQVCCPWNEAENSCFLMICRSMADHAVSGKSRHLRADQSALRSSDLRAEARCIRMDPQRFS